MDPLANLHHIWFKTGEISKKRSSSKCHENWQLRHRRDSLIIVATTGKTTGDFYNNLCSLWSVDLSDWCPASRGLGGFEGIDEGGCLETVWGTEVRWGSQSGRKVKKQKHWKPAFNSVIKHHQNIIFIKSLKIFLGDYFWLTDVFPVCNNSDFLISFQSKIPSNIFKVPKRLSGIFFPNCCFSFFSKGLFSSIQIFSLERMEWKNWLPLMIHNCTFCGFNDRSFFFCNRH